MPREKKKSKPEEMIEMPTVLAFTRAFENGPGYFYQKMLDDKGEMGVYSTPSMRLCTLTYKKKKDETVRTLLQEVDEAFLKPYNDTLVIRWQFKTLPIGLHSCNVDEFRKLLIEKIKEFSEKGCLKELAKRYAYNIVNGRWLWRNRIEAQDIVIKVTCGEEEVIFNNVGDLSLLKPYENIQGIEKIAQWIEDGFNGNVQFIHVEAQLLMGKGLRVFPSLTLVPGESPKLFKMNGSLVFSAQKIANAIRTIDDWYCEKPEFLLPVEVYGQSTARLSAYRTKGNDFYALLGRIFVGKQEVTFEEQCYFMAMLVRGGMFGTKE